MEETNMISRISIARLSSISVVAILIELQICSCGSIGSPLDTAINPSITLISGDGQSAPAGTQLTAPIVVGISDGMSPVMGYPVSFAVTSGGGSLSVSAGSSDVRGLAQFDFTIGATAGSNTAGAYIGDPAEASVSITAVGLAGAPTQLLLASGSNQVGAVGSRLAAPIIVLVEDAHNNSVPNATVAFAVTEGGGSISTTSATTDSNGEATTSLTLGDTAGESTVTATVAGVTPLVVTATATAGRASRLAIVSGNNQTGAAGSPLASPVTVVAEDADANPVGGVTVAFSASAGATVSPTTTTTNASGVAQTQVKLGTTAGPGRVTATALGLSNSPLVFNTTSIAGAASRILLVSGNNQTSTVASQLGAPLVVAVQDANGNAVSNFPVSFVVMAGGGRIPSGNTTSSSQGIAQASFILGPLASTNTAEAIAAGLLGSPVAFSEQGVAGQPSQTILDSGDNQHYPFPLPLVVTIEDIHGNFVPNATVTFTGISSNCNNVSMAATTNANGQASVDLSLVFFLGVCEIRAVAGVAAPVQFTETGIVIL